VSARLLIVNADDYGLTEGVCRAILRGHREGIVTSTSALVIGPAFERCAPWLADAPDLGVGVHLALVGEDPPLLSAAEIPTLVDKDGRLPLSWRRFLPRVAARRIDPADVEREMTAQYERALDAGIRPTHLDTHQHLHLWPAVGEVLTRLAVRWGVPAVRVTRSLGRAPVGRAVNALGGRDARRANAGGLVAPQVFAGFDQGGTHATESLVATIDALGATGAATAEIGLHPGEHGDADLDRYQWGYRWGDELDALVSAEAREAVARNGFSLVTFAALA
jgi:predicted glycoside hydrolase/deacetylase ChbG (UPF0249 family)